MINWDWLQLTLVIGIVFMLTVLSYRDAHADTVTISQDGIITIDSEKGFNHLPILPDNDPGNLPQIPLPRI